MDDVLLGDDDLDGLMDGLNIVSSSSGKIRGAAEDFDRVDDYDYASEGMMMMDDFDDSLDSTEDYDDGVPGDGLGSGVGGDDQDEYGQGSEKGALYDAYNLLHSLAQVRRRLGMCC